MSDYEIREAQPNDNAALIALEKRSPLIVGDAELSFDRAPDFFAGQRLQERWQIAVAVAGEQVIGVCASAVYRAVLLGSERLLAYTHHMRVDPAFQRQGVGRALGRWLSESWKAQGVATDRSYAYIDATNSNSLAFAASGPGPGPWPIDALLHDLPAAAEADQEAEDLDAGDAAEVVALLARTHAGLELCPPFSTAWLQARLSRTPRYSWMHWRGLRQGGRLVAVAGLFDRGASAVAMLRDRRTGASRTSRALNVLDYGYSDEVAMISLLGALRAEAGACGRQSVAIGVPECSPLYAAVMQDAAATMRLRFLGGKQPEAGYALRGVYLDPVYL